MKLKIEKYQPDTLEELVDLYRQMVEAEQAFRTQPKRNLTVEEINAAFAQMDDTPLDQDQDTSTFNPVSLLMTGNKGDEVGATRPKNHIQLRSELERHPAFTNFRDIRQHYEATLI